MREYDEGDPKKPRPVHAPRKGSGAFEAAEAAPWRPILNERERDEHRHV